MVKMIVERIPKQKRQKIVPLPEKICQERTIVHLPEEPSYRLKTPSICAPADFTGGVSQKGAGWL